MKFIVSNNHLLGGLSTHKIIVGTKIVNLIVSANPFTSTYSTFEYHNLYIYHKHTHTKTERRLFKWKCM